MARLDRLKLLRERFAEVPEEAVRLDQWTCGTQACLLGFAARIPEFREQGLYIDPSHGWPTFQGSTCKSAGAEFFQIGPATSAELFDARDEDEPEEEEMKTDKQVALERLDELIAHLEGKVANGQQG